MADSARHNNSTDEFIVRLAACQNRLYAYVYRCCPMPNTPVTSFKKRTWLFGGRRRSFKRGRTSNRGRVKSLSLRCSQPAERSEKISTKRGSG